MAGSRRNNKVQVITCLLKGETISSAAQKAGVGERTVYRWFTEPEFINELRLQEGKVLNACQWRLVSLTRQALDALQDVLENPERRGANTRRLAAVSILEMVLKWRGELDFEERLQALERKVFNGRQ